MICALAVSLFAFVAAGCSDSGDEPEILTSSFVVKGADSSVEEFAPGASRTYQVEAKNIVRTSISQPAGWSADYDDTSLVIVAPSSGAGASAMGDVVVKYVGADGVSGQAVVHVKVNFSTTPPQQQGSFEIMAAFDGSGIEFVVTPDDRTKLYQLAVDSKASYDRFSSDEDFMRYDIEYWQEEYGSDYVTENLVSGVQQGSFPEIPDGTYVVYAYYVDVDTSTGYGFSKDIVVVGNGGSVGPTPTEPSLELEYHIDDSPSWTAFVPGYDPATQGIVVCAATANELVSDWYYGVFLPENCNNSSDDDIRAGLRNNEIYHNQPVAVYPFAWDTELVLCGFYVDMDGNEGPVERIPFVVSLNPSAGYAYEDYLGAWIVSGTGVRGNKVEYEISIEENVRNDSYRVFGFTRTGKDKANNAPVLVSFKAGGVEFYESSTLGIDGENWLGFLGYAYDMANPSNVGYFNINHQTIATGVISGNNILLDWKMFTYGDYKLKYYTFVYGYFVEDDLRNEDFYLYDEDLQDYIVSDMVITRKGAATASNNLAALLARKFFVRRSAR